MIVSITKLYIQLESIPSKIFVFVFSRQTILVKLDTQGTSDLHYSPGDHVAIFPENSPELVDTILIRLHNAPPPDQLIRIEILSERTTLLGNNVFWSFFHSQTHLLTLRNDNV